MIDSRSLAVAARMRRIPTTRCTWIIVLLAAGALIVEALDIGSLGTILPVLRHVMALRPSDVGLLAASSTVGVVIGMIPAGRLADRYGRKRLLLLGTVWFAGATMLAALSPNFVVLLVLRGLSGLGMAPAFIMPFSLVSEFVPQTSRTAFAGLLETALSVGYLLPPLLGLVIMPHFAPEVSWRIFLAVAGLPLVYVWLIWRWLPESPRWLSRAGRYDEAERVLAAIESRVERVLGRALPPPELVVDVHAPAAPIPPVPRWRDLSTVWRPPYLVRTVAMICGATGTFSMFYLGVNYVPSLFVERHISLSNALLFTLIITGAQIPGKISNGILAEHIGRKPTLFGRAAEPLSMVVWGSVILFAASGSAPSYKMWYAEQYPTAIRATGQATVESIGGRLAGGVVWTYLFAVLLAHFGIQTTMTVVAAMGVVALAIVVAFAPETYRRSVEELEALGQVPSAGARADTAPLAAR